MLSDKALKNVQACLANLDELINGRFIFAENMISKILISISESDEIYGLIAECMQNFNFDKEFNRAKVKLPTKDGYFVMPESKAIVLPLVFCILVDIRDKKINFREFVKNYFTSEDINEFENFAQTLIVPFRNAIAYCFDMDNNNQKNTEENIEQNPKTDCQNDYQNDEEIKKETSNLNDDKVNVFIDGVNLILKQILEEISSDKRIKPNLKNDIEYLINAMRECTSNKDVKNLSAYIVALFYVVKPVRTLKFLAQELKQKLIELYA